MLFLIKSKQTRHGGPRPNGAPAQPRGAKETQSHPKGKDIQMVQKYVIASPSLSFPLCIPYVIVFCALRLRAGDLVGGVYLAIQAAMGAYAITPDGSRFMPSYMMISGFNGVLMLNCLRFP